MSPTGAVYYIFTRIKIVQLSLPMSRGSHTPVAAIDTWRSTNELNRSYVSMGAKVILKGDVGQEFSSSTLTLPGGQYRTIPPPYQNYHPKHHRPQNHQLPDWLLNWVVYPPAGSPPKATSPLTCSYLLLHLM